MGFSIVSCAYYYQKVGIILSKLKDSDGNDINLLTPLLEKEIVLTAFTPVKSLVGLLEKFGFKKIKMQYRITFLFGVSNILVFCLVP